jgi:hypothetical protein
MYIVNIAEGWARTTVSVHRATKFTVIRTASVRPLYVVSIHVDGHNWRWIDGSIPMVSIDTFGLIFIDVLDSSVKDFLKYL